VHKKIFIESTSTPKIGREISPLQFICPSLRCSNAAVGLKEGDKLRGSNH